MNPHSKSHWSQITVIEWINPYNPLMPPSYTEAANSKIAGAPVTTAEGQF